MKKANLQAMRHSCSHVLAAAVKKLHPRVKFGIGPAIKNGFYYDFEFKEPVSENDLPKIEEEMKKMIRKNLKFIKKEVCLSEAKKIFKTQPYKLDLLTGVTPVKGLPLKILKITTYQTGDFVDLCKGPHVKSTKEIGPFKLLSVAGAYWRGDEKNPMLTRIYGTCFSTQKELDEHLKMLAEAKKRDHRRLGKELDLFTISDEVGAGLPIWHPKLSIVREEIEKFWKKEHKKRGYQYVYSPHIGKKSLWVKSGHWKFYRDLMYSPMEIEGVDYLIKPMNCPFHVQIYKSKIRSYRDLPIRYCELGTVYRFEPSGTLHGLTRVRGFTQDDSHIFCRPDQIKEEVLGVLDLAFEMLNSFGIEDYQIGLSVRDPKAKEKYMGSDEIWERAEGALEEALKTKKIEYKRAEGEAVFYGPKIDISLMDSLGRKWQCTTIQVDFNFPEKFDLFYIDKEGKKQQVVMVHRTILGAMERFMGCLIEHYGGAFPVWLAPVQVVIIPVANRHLKFTRDQSKKLIEENIRVEVDGRSETVEAKIRDAELQKIPYILVVGDKEVKKKTVSVRKRGGRKLTEMKGENFLAKIRTEIERKK